MKNGHAIIGISGVMLSLCFVVGTTLEACKPKPSPTPVPVPVPVPPAPTCDNVPLGTLVDIPCPPKQTGKHTGVCTVKGMVDVSNTCVMPIEAKAELPSIYKIHKGDKLSLQLRPQDGVTYKWSTGDTGPLIWVTPTTDTLYSVVAKGSDSSEMAQTTVIVE